MGKTFHRNRDFDDNEEYNYKSEKKRSKNSRSKRQREYPNDESIKLESFETFYKKGKR